MIGEAEEPAVQLRDGRRAAVVAHLARAIPVRKPIWVTSFGQYAVRCWRDRPAAIDDGTVFTFRSVNMDVLLEGALVGRAELEEWMVSPSAPDYENTPFPDADQFYSEADDWSFEASRMAGVVQRNWEWDHFPGDYGAIVEFRRLAIDSAFDVNRGALDAVGMALQKEFSRRAAVVLLLAFPLEFEHNVGEPGSETATKFEARRRAMQRHYRHHLGFQPLPDQQTHPGWMWRPMRYCPDPLQTALSLDDLVEEGRR